MATKKRKKKKKKSSGGGSGTMSSFRGGMKRLVGQGSKGKKESTASKLFTWILFAAALGVLIYRLSR